MLLILAGVTITAITGDNGIIKQAQDAAEATNYSQAREKIEMQILQSYNKNGDIDLDKLTDNFIKNIPGAQIRGDDGSATDISDDNRITDLPVTVVVDGYDFTIWGSGTVTGEGEEKPSQDKFNITSLNLTSTEDSITAKVQASNGNGATYTYYYKLSSSSDWIQIHKGTETTCTIEGLEPGESYDIKVEAINGEESSSKEGTISTQEHSIAIPDANTPGVIDVQGPNWNGDGTASITVTKGDGVDDSLYIEYKKDGDTDYTRVDGDTIGGIASGDKIYIHLTDGTTDGTDKVIEVKDLTNPTVVVSQGAVTETSIQITVNATDSESGIPSPATYKYYIKKSTEGTYSNEPTATDGNAGYTFTNLDDNTSYDIKVEVVDRAGNTGSGESKGVKTLITIPNINDDGVINVGGPNWNGDGTADVTITKGDNVDDDLTIEYKKEGDDDYTPLGDGETIEGLESGDKIYIHLTDGDRTSEDKVIEIKDETGPTVEVTQGATSTNGITVNVEVHDGESGMPASPTYNYYIKKTSDADYPAQPTATDTNASHTFIGLVQGESYDIKVEVVDNAGNTGTGTLPGITTDTVPDAGDDQTGSIVWSNVKWDQNTGTASVTVSKGAGVSDSLQIQYQIVANSETQPQEDSYTDIGNGGTISNLTSGNVVYARLWDGNNAGSPASINIEDSVLPTVTLTQGTVAETTIAVSVSATDNESGVSSSASYKYYYKKSTEINYPSTPAATVNSTSYIFEGLEPGTTYDVKVEVADNAGNVGSDEIKGITTLATIPDINVEGTINVEGPTWSNGTASVTISKGADVSSGLYLEYRKGDTGTFTRVTGNSVSIDGLVNGDKIYVHLTDGTRTSEDKVIEITDTVAPSATISLSSTTVSTDGSITATVTQTDADSGIDITKTKYVYNTTATEIGTDEASYTGTFSKTPQDIILNATIAGTYYLHVLTVDNAGNKKETISEPVTVSTSQGGSQGGEQGGSGTDIQTGAIQFGDLQWDETNTTASVTVNKTESNELELQYKIGEGTWTTIENGGTITGLKDGDVVTACLYDGTTRGYYTTLNVQAPDTTAPSAIITLSATSATAGNSITATVNQTDDKSGIDLAQTKYVYNTTATEIGTDEASYTGGTFSKNPQDIILNATTAGTYYLHVLSVDKAGNKKETISEAVTVEEPKGPVYLDGMTYKEGDEDTGIVAIDEAGNEWVWVEVPKSIYTTATSDTDYDAIYNDMKTYTSDYSDFDYADEDNGSSSSYIDYNTEKNRMLKNVYDNGGFWISRYEIGTFDTTQSIENENISVIESVATPVSKQNAYPIVTKSFSGAQNLVRKINTQANLLFGVQWDLTLRFLQEKVGLNVSELNRNSTSWGNYRNTSFTIDRGKYTTDSTSSSSITWSDATNVTKPSSSSWILTTGAAERNKKMNIYDLAGNVEEWTLERNTFLGYARTFRGGGSSASYRDDDYSDYMGGVVGEPIDNNEYAGFRAALYGEGHRESGSTEPQTGAIEYGDLQWDDSYSTASVTVSKTGSNTLELQYRINTGEWQTVDSGYTITGLKAGDIVTACLFDGSSRGYYTTLNVVAPEPGSAEYIASHPDEYYGQYVDYQPKNGDTEVKWKIFYAGTNPNDPSDTTSRIYLIADDYISSEYAPQGKDGSSISTTRTNYTLAFDNVISDYSGSSDVTNSLVKPWLSYLNSYPDSTNDNMKAVAYMLDTNVWSTFKDSSGKAEYAIGGPTLDLFCASYNQKYPTKTIQYQTSNSRGYQVKWSSDSSYSTSISGLPTNDSLYVISDTDKAHAMWLASPSAHDHAGAYYVMIVHSIGNVSVDYCDGLANYPGFRPVVCLKAGTELKQKEDGTYEIVSETEKVDADDITSNPEEYYGQYVDYQPSNGDTEVKWKIFYAGTNPNDSTDTTNRIYLIADDYISSQYAPRGQGGSSIYVNDTDYRLSFNNVIGDYKGSSDVTNSLVKPWLSYLNSYPSSTKNNMKAVAYMLDTNIWNTFTDSTGKAEYAIGGPTLDLFSASYNQKYPNKQIQYQANSIGYQVRWSTGGSYTTSISGLPTNDSLYVISDTDKAYAMWLASPSAYDYSGVMFVYYVGHVNYDSYNDFRPGFRPLVCLKSGVQLEQQADGTYKITSGEEGEVGGETTPAPNPQTPTLDVELREGDKQDTLAVTASSQAGVRSVELVNQEEKREYSNSPASVNESFTILENGSYTVRVTFADGSTMEKEVDVTNIKLDPVAQIGSNQYETIGEAVNAVSANNTKTTIEILKDFTQSMPVYIPDNKNIVLDLKGHTITLSTGIIYNRGTLEIQSTSSDAGTIISNHTEKVCIANDANLTITSGKLTAGQTNVLRNNGTGTITINGGTVEENSSSYPAIINMDTATLNIANGTVVANNTVPVANYGTGNIAISGGNVSTQASNAIANQSTGNVTITNGTISSTSSNGPTIWNETTGTINIGGGNITATSSVGVYNKGNGVITISGGSITSTSSNAVNNNSAGTINMTNGTLTGGASGRPALMNVTNGKVNIGGGNINGNDGASGIYNNGSGTITITDGTITTTGADGYALANASNGTMQLSGGAATSTNAVTLLNYSSGSAVVDGIALAQQDGTTPVIYNNSTGAITVNQGTFTSTGSNVLTNISTGTVELNGGTFTGQGASLPTIYNAAEGGSITVDGATISGENTGSAVYNEGNFTLKSGSITATGESVAINDQGTGNTTIESGEITTTGARNTLYHSSTGTLTINGGTITQNSQYDAIVNYKTGTVTINNGNLNSTQGTLIDNYSTGTLVVNGGTLAATGGNTIYSGDAGSITVKGGTLTTDGTAIGGDVGTVTLGEDDGTVSTTQPDITSPNNSYTITIPTLNFYDGIIKGGGIDTNVTVSTPAGKTVHSDTSGAVHTTTLQ